MNLGELSTELCDTVIQVSVFVDAIREFESTRGTMAFVQVKDQYDEVEVVVFSKLYEECKKLLLSGDELLLTASVQAGESDDLSLVLKGIRKVD